MSAIYRSMLASGLSNLSSLETLYIGLSGRPQADSQEFFSIRLSGLPNLKALHIDSFWPRGIQVPPHCAVHASFISDPGQKLDGIWAGDPYLLGSYFMQELPRNSSHFVQNTAHSWRLTARLLWPLEARVQLEMVRIKADLLCLDKQDAVCRYLQYPGLMRAQKVVIVASVCSLTVDAFEGWMKWKHVTLKCLESSTLVS